MGLGKTFTGAEKLIRLRGNVNLVVCQKSKIEDWRDHFREYYGNEIEVYDLTVDKQFNYFIDNPRGLLFRVGIINYDLIFRRPRLGVFPIDTLLLDESSLIQNETSKRSKFILKKMNFKNVILLSGTPTNGKYENLWSQLQLLGWNISKDLFWSHYVDFEWQDQNGFPMKVVKGYKNVDRLKRKLRDHGAQFLKTEEVIDLPEKFEQFVRIPTIKEYRKFRKDSIVEIENVQIVGDSILTKMLYERQLCGQYNSRKLSAFRDLVESTSDRLIVFYNFTAELKAMLEITHDCGRQCSIVSGITKYLTAYEDDDSSVTFVQYQAGAMGLNLQKANKIIYFTPPLSSELFEQSKKRIHRIGQKSTCHYHMLICQKSIEERIYSTLKMRKDYTDELFREDIENGR